MRLGVLRCRANDTCRQGQLRIYAPDPIIAALTAGMAPAADAAVVGTAPVEGYRMATLAAVGVTAAAVGVAAAAGVASTRAAIASTGAAAACSVAGMATGAGTVDSAGDGSVSPLGMIDETVPEAATGDGPNKAPRNEPAGAGAADAAGSAEAGRSIVAAAAAAGAAVEAAGTVAAAAAVAGAAVGAPPKSDMMPALAAGAVAAAVGAAPAIVAFGRTIFGAEATEGAGVRRLAG